MNLSQIICLARRPQFLQKTIERCPARRWKARWRSSWRAAAAGSGRGGAEGLSQSRAPIAPKPKPKTPPHPHPHPHPHPTPTPPSAQTQTQLNQHYTPAHPAATAHPCPCPSPSPSRMPDSSPAPRPYAVLASLAAVQDLIKSAPSLLCLYIHASWQVAHLCCLCFYLRVLIECVDECSTGARPAAVGSPHPIGSSSTPQPTRS